MSMSKAFSLGATEKVKESVSAALFLSAPRHSCKIAIRTFIEMILPVVVGQESVLRGFEVVFRDRLQPRRVFEAVIEPKDAISRFRSVGQRLCEIRFATEQTREAGELVRTSNGGVRDVPQLRVVFRAVLAFLDGLGKVKLGVFEDTKSNGRKREREAERQVLQGARAGGARRRILERESSNTVIDALGRISRDVKWRSLEAKERADSPLCDPIWGQRG